MSKFIFKGFVMKKFTLFLILLGTLLSGCASNNSPEPVAMNLYSPNDPEGETISGVTVEITQEMIDEYRKNHSMKQ